MDLEPGQYQEESIHEKSVNEASGDPGLQGYTFTWVTKLSIILTILSCLLYANTLRNDYVLDDVTMITENHYVQQGFSGIPLLLTTHHMEGFSANRMSDYRPLSLVMFAIEYQFFGLDPAMGHFFNIVFFAAAVVFLFLFLNKLFNGEKIVVAFVAALLFAVHPVHTEVVANIKSRDELMCFFFAFAALNVLINYARQGRWYQLPCGIILLVLAVLSKETVLTFLGVIPLIFFFYENQNKKRSLLITLGMVAVVIFFLFIWNYVQTRDTEQPSLAANLIHSSSIGAGGSTARVAPKLLILGYQLRLLFVPYPLNSHYSFSDVAHVSFTNIGVLLSIAAYLFLVYMGLMKLFKNKKDPWAFAILFYLITLSLFSNLIFTLGQPLANRYAFFPSVGFCLACALAFERWISTEQAGDIAALKNWRPIAVLVPVLLVFSAMTIARNTDWKDNLTLVNADLSKSSGDYISQYKVGLELQVKYDSEPDTAAKRRINDLSIKYFLRSLQINPGYTEAHSDLGVAYFRENNFDSAEFHFKKVLELNPLHYNAAFNLATIFFKEQRFPEAVFYYEKAVRIDSAVDVAAWYNMGICYTRLRQFDTAIRCSKKVIAAAPQFAGYRSFCNLALLYQIIGNADSTKKYEQIAQKYYQGFHVPSSVE